MDKYGLGPILDENGNVKYLTTKEDKINIYTDTLLGISHSAASALFQFVTPKGTSVINRDHIAVDIPDRPGTSKGVRTRSNAEKLRLNHVYVSANECVDQLEKVRRRLTTFASREKVLRPGFDFVQLAELSYQIMTLAREAFVPAHSLCSAVIGLYMTEDYIRAPVHVEFPDYFEGRIRIPSKKSNRKTLLQLQMCIDTVTELYAKFGVKNKYGVKEAYNLDEMRQVLLMVRHIMQELYSTGSGCLDLLNILLYIEEPPEQEAFMEFLNNLTSMEKSDLLEGISKLRRTVDYIPPLLERLSWTSYTVYRLASGNSPLNSPPSTELNTPSLSTSNSKQSLQIQKHKMETEVASVRAENSKARSSSQDVKRKPPQSVTDCERRKSTIQADDDHNQRSISRSSSVSKDKSRVHAQQESDGHSSRSSSKDNRSKK